MSMRVAPKAVCRQMLARLQSHDPLTEAEQRRVIHALNKCGVPDVTDRLIAGLSRNTLELLLEKF